MATYDERLNAVAARAEADSDILHTFANGDANTSVTTESGILPSLAKWLTDVDAGVFLNDGQWPYATKTPQYFGAVADGVTDDTTAMQQWADQGGLLPLPAGAYLVTSPINFKSGSVVMGASCGLGTSGTETPATQATKGVSVVVAGASFTGTRIFNFKDDTQTSMWGAGITNVRFECDGSNASAIVMEKAYDGVMISNLNIMRLGDTAHAIRIQPNADIAANGISQTILIQNVMGIHKSSTATASTFYFDQCQEMNLVGVKGFGGFEGNEPSANPIELVDCRGVTLTGCSTAHTTDAGIYIRSVTRSSDGISIVGHTYENCTAGGIKIRGSASPNNVARVYNINPRYQFPQAIAADVDGADACVIDIGIRDAVLGADTDLNRIYATIGQTQVTDNGTNNTVVAYKNSVNAEETWNVGLNIPSLKVGGYSIKRNVEVVNVLGNKTLALSDYNVEQKMASSTAQTLTIPTNTSVAFLVDATKIPIRRTGAGAVTIQAPVGVTLNGVDGGSCTLDRYKACVLCKDGASTWTIVGGNSVVS